jgi:hypothetical protein
MCISTWVFFDLPGIMPLQVKGSSTNSPAGV